MARNAVVDTALAYLKRHGWCDFTGDGSFDPGTETQLALNEGSELPAGVPDYYIKIVAGDFAEMAPAEKLAVDAALLNQFKIEKATTFDRHTLQILAEGIEYPAASGDFYAITPDALLAVQSMRDVGVFPFLIHALRYTNILVVNNLAEANALLVAARDKMVDVLQEGTALLQQIKAAPDKATLDAIVDPR